MRAVNNPQEVWAHILGADQQLELGNLPQAVEHANHARVMLGALNEDLFPISSAVPSLDERAVREFVANTRQWAIAGTLGVPW